MNDDERFEACLQRFRQTIYSRAELDRLSREAGSEIARDAAYRVLQEREERSYDREYKRRFSG